VWLYFDESGDFAFGPASFDAYVLAALICPDELRATLEDYVAECKAVWKVDELHATSLSGPQLVEIAGFIRRTRVSLLACVTDTALISIRDIERHRLDQAATLRRNLDWYRRESTRARGAPVPEIEAWMNRMLKRAGLSSQISHGEYLQAQLLIDQIGDALQKAVLAYAFDAWRGDSWDFHFVLDGKLPRKLAAGEKFLNDAVVPALGSRAGSSLGLSDVWKSDPFHPFIAKYSRDRGRIRGREVDGVTDLSAIFSEGLRFEDSREHAGLQLVDAAAYIVRRAVLAADDAEIQYAYDLLRPALRTEGGRALRIFRLGSHEPTAASLDRYRPLYGGTRQ
jgi:hypothetical protein